MTVATVTVLRNEEECVTLLVEADVDLSPDDVSLERMKYRINCDEDGPLEDFAGVFPLTRGESELVELVLENKAVEVARDRIENLRESQWESR